MFKFYPMNLLEVIKDDKFPEKQYVPQIPSLIYSISCGLAFMHKKDIVHFDMKSSNILLDQDSKGWLIPHISDFGIAQVEESSLVNGMKQDYAVGYSSGYAAPEIYGISVLVIRRTIREAS